MISEQFVCDLNKCKGGCCEDGDSGAPLADKELEYLREMVEEVKPYLTPEGLKVLEKEGLYKYDQEFGWVTPTIAGKCAPTDSGINRELSNAGLNRRTWIKKSHGKNRSAVIYFR